MLGFGPIGESALSALDDVVPAEGVSRGFTVGPRLRTFEMQARGRVFTMPHRPRVFGGDDPMARCCVFGGSFCKTATESEFVYFNFGNRLGTRTIDTVESPVVAPAGMTADNEQLLEDDLELETGDTLLEGKAVAVLLGGGTVGETYAVTVAVNVSTGERLEQVGYVTIEAAE